MIKRFTPVMMTVCLVGCAPAVVENEMPETLPELKVALQERREQLRELSEEIATIEEKIAELDPTTRRAAKLVTTAPVERMDFRHYVTVQGSIQAADIVSGSSETGGRIKWLGVKEGDAVSRGQRIATVDLETLRKQREEVTKTLELAEDLYQRQSRLWEQKIGSEMQFLQAKNNKERLEQSLETIDFELTRSEVYAPISGVVDRVMLKEGELAGPAMPIVRILNTNKLKVVADAPENLIGAVKTGDMVELHFPSLSEELEARVSLLGRQIDPANRTFAIEVNLPKRSSLYKPNLLTEIRINDYTEKNVIAIPLELLQQEVGGRDFVMVAQPDSDGYIGQKVYIETGTSYGGMIVVKQGLLDDQILVASGARGLVSGERVEIVTEEKPEI